MEKGIDMDALKKIIQCSICLETYDDPRQLTCGHQFCTMCLEGAIIFRQGGTGVITCALCQHVTEIGAQKTVKDLHVSYDFRSLLDLCKLGEESASRVKCVFCQNRSASVHCCETLMCTYCNKKHRERDKLNQHHYKSLIFNTRENCLQVVCDRHKTNCTRATGDGTFMCVYCLRRDNAHRHMNVDTVVAVAEQIRESVSKEIDKNVMVTSVLEHTKNEVQLKKTELHFLIENRKKAALQNYEDFLNEHEKNLKTEFDQISKNHLKKYNNISVGYYEHLLAKIDVDLVLCKKAISKSISKQRTKIVKQTVSFTEAVDFLSSSSPLGKLVVKKEEELLTTKDLLLNKEEKLFTSKKDCASSSTLVCDFSGHFVEGLDLILEFDEF